MPNLKALQHLFSSVERGYSPGQGRGFQTVAVSVELVGTEDLVVLERACYYAVTPDRRERGHLPVKETFFRLPSGRYAIGRTRDFGTDALGRDGNYLAYHVVVNTNDLLALGGTPFPVLDALPELGDRPDLKPCNLPALELHAAAESAASPPAPSRELLSDLAAAAVDGTGRTLVIVGDEQRSRPLVRALYPLLPRDERLELTYSSHFYASESLRALFRVVTAAEPGEAPPAGGDFQRFDLDGTTGAGSGVGNPYSVWLRREIRAGNWAGITAVNEAIDALRADPRGVSLERLDTAACAAAWDRASASVLALLLGVPELQSRLLGPESPVRAPVALALLGAGSPSLLLGEDPPAEPAAELLRLLKSLVPARAWRDWTTQWKKDPQLAVLNSGKRPWWRIWR